MIRQYYPNLYVLKICVVLVLCCFSSASFSSKWSVTIFWYGFLSRIKRINSLLQLFPICNFPFFFSFWLSNVSKDIESSIFYYLVDRNGIWYSECSTLYVRKRIQLLSPWRFNDVYVGQEDPSQVFLLAGVWLLFLGFGSSACLIPVIYSIGHAYQDAFSSGYYYSSQPSQFLAILNGMLFMALGSVIGYPIASASGNNLLSSYWYISI